MTWDPRYHSRIVPMVFRAKDAVCVELLILGESPNLAFLWHLLQDVTCACILRFIMVGFKLHK